MCVVDIGNLDPSDDVAMDILGQSGSQLGSSSSLALVQNMWAEGGEGITMFHTSDDRLSITHDSRVGSQMGGGEGQKGSLRESR